MRLRSVVFMLTIVTLPLMEWPHRSIAQPPQDAATVVPDTPAESPLQTLDWLVGSWTVAGGESGAEFSCHFSKNNAFLLRSFTFTATASQSPTSGMQIIAWDPAAKSVRSWTYDSDGGFGEDTWTQNGNRYTLRSVYTYADGGKASMVNVATLIDSDHFSWKSVQREIDGELQPDLEEIVFAREVAVQNQAEGQSP